MANAIGKSQWAQAASAAVGSSAKAATSLISTPTDRTRHQHRRPVNSSVTRSVPAWPAPSGVVVFRLAGAGLTFWGVSRRIEEYR